MLPLLVIFWTYEKGDSPNPNNEINELAVTQAPTKKEKITHQDGRSFSSEAISAFKIDKIFTVQSLDPKSQWKTNLEVSNGFIIFSSYPAIQISDWHSPTSNCIGGEPEKNHPLIDRLLLCKAVKGHTAGEGWAGLKKIEIKKNELFLKHESKDKVNYYTLVTSK